MGVGARASGEETVGSMIVDRGRGRKDWWAYLSTLIVIIVAGVTIRYAVPETTETPEPPAPAPATIQQSTSSTATDVDYPIILSREGRLQAQQVHCIEHADLEALIADVVMITEKGTLAMLGYVDDQGNARALTETDLPREISSREFQRRQPDYAR